MTYGNSRWLFGGVLDRVLQEMTRPIVVVRAPSNGNTPLMDGHKILVSVDTSSYSGRVLPLAEEIAGALRASILLCHVVAPVGGYQDVADAPPGVAHIIENLLAEGQSFVDRVARDVESRGLPVETVVALGEPQHLIAMATRGHDRLEKRMMGSVASAVVRSAQAPCLLIRPPAAN
jgi:nucleotide-binding universal stress UspA family protein